MPEIRIDWKKKNCRWGILKIKRIESIKIAGLRNDMVRTSV